MNILIVTDAWKPQVNGVVTTLTNIVNILRKNNNVKVVTIDNCKVKVPTPYPGVKMGFFLDHKISENVQWADAIHIATPEGTIGTRYRRELEKRNITFTTGYHTKWPEFLKAMLHIPEDFTYPYLRKVNKHSKAVLVPTEAARKELEEKGFKNVKTWTRGVDRSNFTFNDAPEDYIVCVSRVSKEKGLDDFCSLPYPNKVVVGDGPYLVELKRKYTDVDFVGVKHGKELADYYRNAKVFVFPSKADTFGVVMIEAMACGTPVAAYPVTGPVDVIDSGITGTMHENLQVAIEQAKTLDRRAVYEFSKKWDWGTSASQFKEFLVQRV